MTVTYVSNHPTGFSIQYDRLKYKCPVATCYYSVGVKELVVPNHKCPTAGQTRIAWGVYGPSLLQKTWDELDQVTARLMESPEIRQVDDRGYARGLAFTLSLFMVPHFTTPQDIAREAKKRFDMKKAGEAYETPGLGQRKYEPPPGSNKLSQDSPEKQRVMASSPSSKLTAEEIAGIKHAAQMFKPEELAGVFKVPLATIKSILSQ